MAGATSHDAEVAREAEAGVSRDGEVPELPPTEIEPEVTVYAEDTELERTITLGGGVAIGVGGGVRCSPATECRCTPRTRGS